MNENTNENTPLIITVQQANIIAHALGEFPAKSVLASIDILRALPPLGLNKKEENESKEKEG